MKGKRDMWTIALLAVIAAVVWFIPELKVRVVGGALKLWNHLKRVFTQE